MQKFSTDQQQPSRRAMGIEEFCGQYGLGRTRVYQEIKMGRLSARKVGRRTLITLDDAEDWLRRLPVVKTNPVPTLDRDYHDGENRG